MAEGRRLRIGIVAGEASGDLLGSHLIAALCEKLPDIDFIGIAGPKMQAAGAKSLFPMEKLAVRGYLEVLRHFAEILGIRRKLKRYFLANPPDLFIGVDAPDFNLGLEKTLKAHGIPTIHYVSPSVWAWRRERVKTIARSVTHILALFPFEPKIYEEAGVPVTYVGHPMADMLPQQPDRAAMRVQLKLPAQGNIIAMLPGSRQSELHYMAELFIRTAQKIASVEPDIQFLVPLISRETRDFFQDAMYKLDAGNLPLKILFGHAHTALTAANVVLVASGTATLETALLKRPMVITYKLSRLSAFLMRRKGYLPYVGLPNVLAGRFVVPELLQEDATPDNLSQALLNLLHDTQVQNGLEAEFQHMHESLRQNTAERACAAVLHYVPQWSKA
ncbi:MAG: lipid-A-disaccharide synthase [Gammaproteobacteria bacterium]|nr:lipid-A-disaccharide synthase [Gammaproteobacteria bacterium]MBU1733403.1 lipid-A-disaccharide synthase [Gammaproteobacteria bacterium]MBU1891820.1 lipid-A-disaccharide synthase [Gammaproteobacteria bacterium]